MRFCLLVGFFVALVLGTSAANATVDVSIDLSRQRMNVTSSSGSYSWPISSGRAGFATPRGVFEPQAMYRMTYSIPYNNAPMPHAIFFTGGYAIHGTAETGALGIPASHGCVRLAPGNAATLYQLVKAEGAKITIEGIAPLPRVARSVRGTDKKVARHKRDHGTKYAHGKRGNATKYARNSRSKSRQVAERAQPAPPSQDMYALFGAGF